MSGLYNMVFGVNHAAAFLLDAAKIDHKKVPRFRDCFLYKDGKSIVVYTRTGGGNREDYVEENAAMTQWPGYIRDEDDSFDNTYALFHFKVPEDAKEICDKLKEIGMAVDPPERWKKMLAALRERTV